MHCKDSGWYLEAFREEMSIFAFLDGSKQAARRGGKIDPNK